MERYIDEARAIIKNLVISEVLAAVNLLVVFVLCLPYVPIVNPFVTVIQFAVIPLLLLTTIAFAVKDFLRPSTRLHSLTALVLSFPACFIYLVWRGWIEP